ncbi:hypothetical protein [Nocardia macrotermitis]|uniref:CBM6 domain-containing protein n=1 Tax=Nocardia macrotermitis TaxID=2585198 RepID=A0A7K0DBG4_9NOCA|nr:hypothetical protein [Nocardia macrotermitis]MQY22861.1 hypothetical protein [Nocardia macrotermitis]
MTSSLRLGRTRTVAAFAAAACLGGTAFANAVPLTVDPHPSAAANLVANANFRSGLNGWGTHVYHANVGGNGATVHDNGYIGQDVPVTNGARYTYSVRAGANPGGSVLALALDSRTGVAYVSRTVTAATNVSQTFTAVGPTVYIACQAGGGAGGWCNDFSLVAAPGPSSGSAGTGSAG